MVDVKQHLRDNLRAVDNAITRTPAQSIAPPPQSPLAGQDFTASEQVQLSDVVKDGYRQILGVENQTLQNVTFPQIVPK